MTDALALALAEAVTASVMLPTVSVLTFVLPPNRVPLLLSGSFFKYVCVTLTEADAFALAAVNVRSLTFQQMNKH